MGFIPSSRRLLVPLRFRRHPPLPLPSSSSSSSSSSGSRRRRISAATVQSGTVGVALWMCAHSQINPSAAQHEFLAPYNCLPWALIFPNWIRTAQLGATTSQSLHKRGLRSEVELAANKIGKEARRRICHGCNLHSRVRDLLRGRERCLHGVGERKFIATLPQRSAAGELGSASGTADVEGSPSRTATAYD